MAVVEYYTNAQLTAGKLADPASTYGAQPFTMISTFTVANGDSIGSIYRIGKGIDASLVPSKISFFNDAITSAAMSLGIYGTGIGKPVPVANSQQLFDTAVSIASAHPVTSSPQIALTNVTIPQRGLRICDLLGLTDATKLSAYDLAVTLTAAATATGNMCFIVEFIQG
jgi:hypothetical protein